MKNMLTKYSVDILAILILLVWTIFFGILLITTVSPQRFHHFLLSDSLTMMTVIPEQVWIHRIPLKGEKPCPWEYLDYFSMYLEISDSVGSSDRLKFFSHRPQRCPWPWRFLRRGCPDCISTLCQEGPGAPLVALLSTVWEGHLSHWCGEEAGPTGRHWRVSGAWCSSWLLLATSENVPGLQTWDH